MLKFVECTWDASFLASENPFPPSEQGREKVLSELESLNLYPSPRSSALRECVANLHSLAENQVIIGNGSDDLLNLCVRCFADENLKVGMLAPSYSLYETLASIQGAKVVGISFANENFELPVTSGIFFLIIIFATVTINLFPIAPPG